MFTTVLSLTGPPAHAQQTESVDLVTTAVGTTDPASGQFALNPVTMSTDARYVAFRSDSANLVADDTNGQPDIFVRDRTLGTTVRANLTADGLEHSQNDGGDYQPRISADGRHVAFLSYSDSLVAGDTNGKVDAFVRDLDTNETQLVSLGPAGQQSNQHTAGGVDISGDGRFVAFGGYPSNWGADMTYSGIWLRDRLNNTTTLIKAGSASFGSPGGARISDDGKVVAFVVGTPSGRNALYAYDTETSTLSRVDIRTDGTPADGYHIFSYDLSADGHTIAFEDDDSLVSPDVNGANYSDIYVRDITAGTTRLASLSNAGTQAPNPASDASISADGRFVSFTHYWGTITPPAGWDAGSDVYVHDMSYGSTWHVGVSGYGANSAGGAVLDGSGRRVAMLASGGSPYTSSSQIYVATRVADSTPPSVYGSPRTSPNSDGWYQAPVTVDWYAYDAEPSWGPASTPAPTVASTEGTQTYTSGQSCDAAGNCATGSVQLSIDTGLPGVSLTTPADGAVYNNGDAASASFSCSDGVSGLADTGGCVGSVADGAALDMSVGAHSVSVTATDKAGNQKTVQHDYSVAAAVPSAPQYVWAAAGDASVTVNWTAPASDGGATITQYQVTANPGGATTVVAGTATSATLTGLTNGTAYTLSVVASNSAGPGFSTAADPVTPQANAPTPTIVTRTVDPDTGGTVTTDDGSGATAANPLTTTVTVPAGATGDTVTIAETTTSGSAPSGYAFLGQQADITAPAATASNPLVIVFRIDASIVAGRLPADIDLTRAEGTGASAVLAPCTDPNAGVAAPDPCVVKAYAGDGSGDVLLTAYTSHASHWNTAVRSDSTAPTISVSSPTDGSTYTYGQTVAISFGCSEEIGGSGLASCTGTVTADGSTRAVAGTGARVDTTRVGRQVLTVTATDKAGNSRTRTVSYQVVYPFGGFYAPVTSAGTATLKAGGTLSLVFSLGGNRGTAVLAARSPVSYPASCATRNRTGQDELTAGSLVYTSKSARYTYGWQTAKQWAGTCRMVVLKLNDGTSHPVFVTLTR